MPFDHGESGKWFRKKGERNRLICSITEDTYMRWLEKDGHTNCA